VQHLIIKLVLVVVLLFVGCYSGSKLAKQNIAGLYLPNSTVKSKVVDYKYANEGASIILFLQLHSFNLKRNITNFDAKLSIKLYNNAKTTSALREIVQPIKISNLSSEFSFDVIDAYDLIAYTLESDNLIEPITGFLNIDEFESNDLIIQKKQNSTNTSYLIKNEKLTFEENKVTVKYFDTSRNIALPPYITDVERLIANPEITAETSLSEMNFTPQKTGYYLFESNGKYNATLCVDENFPGLNNFKTQVLSLRYITKNEEFKQIAIDKNIEAAIDSFWMSIGNNKARANKLKQEYLLRLKTSNEHFTSISAGWQTSRGMIYTIFGPPDEVYKITEGENWYYGQPKVEFKFIKKKILNNYNYYQLQRNENLALYWHQAVNKWRNGHIKSTEVLE